MVSDHCQEKLPVLLTTLTTLTLNHFNKPAGGHEKRGSSLEYNLDAAGGYHTCLQSSCISATSVFPQARLLTPLWKDWKTNAGKCQHHTVYDLPTDGK